MEHPFGHRKEVHICRETSAESCCWSFGNTRPPYQHCGSLYFHEWTCPNPRWYPKTHPPRMTWLDPHPSDGLALRIGFQHLKKKVSAKIHDHPWLSDATGTFPSWMDSGVALTWPDVRLKKWDSNPVQRSDLHHDFTMPPILVKKNISFPPEVRQNNPKKVMKKVWSPLKILAYLTNLFSPMIPQKTTFPASRSRLRLGSCSGFISQLLRLHLAAATAAGDKASSITFAYGKPRHQNPTTYIGTLWWTNIAIENGHRNSGPQMGILF